MNDRKGMIGILMLSSVIFLGSCEEGTVTVKKSDKNSKKGIATISSKKGSIKTSKDLKGGPTKTSELFKDLGASQKKEGSKLSRDVKHEVEEFANGDGTAVNPYQITSIAELKLVRKHLTSHFQLIEDLDLEDEKDFFYSIGDESTPFEGTFDGNGKKIENLIVQRPRSRSVGFFGVLGEGGVLKNIILKDIRVIGNNYVGGLVGWNNGGRIEGSEVEGGDVTGVEDVGGLVGVNNEGSIEASKSNVSVIGVVEVKGSNIGGLVGVNSARIIDSTWVGKEVTGKLSTGGLVGSNSSKAVIERSRAIGNGNVTGMFIVGGLVGNNLGTIESSYSEVEVKGSNILGGLVGINEKDGEIKNSYATGKTGLNESTVGGLVGQNKGTIENTFAWGSVGRISLTFREYVGGLVGRNEGGRIVGKNYWQGSIRPGVGKSKNTKGPINIATVIKEVPDNFKKLNANNTGWDKDTWDFNSAVGYPVLKWQVE